MNVSIKPVLRTDKINKNNRAPIHIRFTQNRQKKHIATGISINVEDWDCENQRITANSDENRQFQFQIDSTLQDYYKKAKRLEALEMEITLDSLIETNSRKTPNQTISEYFSKLIGDFKRSGKLSTASKYSFCLSSLDKFRPTSVTFDKVDKQFLAEFEQYLRDRGLSGNTIATKFTNLKSAYNKALSIYSYIIPLR